MTRLVTCGYETGDVNEQGTSTVGTNANITAVSSTPTPRLGSYSLKFTSAGTTVNQASKTMTLAASKTEVWLRWGFYAHYLNLSGEFDIAAVLDSAAGVVSRVTYSSTDNLLRVYGTALLGTASLTAAQDIWHTLEWRHQMTSVTVGISELWLNGTRVVNFSGDNCATSTANVLSVRFGQSTGNSSFTTGSYHALDDLAINDTNGSINNGQINDGRVVLLKPNGAGSTTAQTRGGTDTGANYSQVNEIPPSLTQYVFSASAGTRDTYALEDVPAGSWTVNCCEVLALGQNSDTGTGSLGLTVKSGATTNEGTAQNLGTTAAYIRQLYELDPNTSAAWSVSAVNALEAGSTVR